MTPPGPVQLLVRQLWVLTAAICFLSGPHETTSIHLTRPLEQLSRERALAPDLHPFDLVSTAVKPENSKRPIDVGLEFCNWAGTAPIGDVCAAFSVMGHTIHGEHKENLAILEAHVKAHRQKHMDYPRDWTVEALKLTPQATLDGPGTLLDKYPEATALTEVELEHAQAREAIYWAGESRLLTTTASTLASLKMSGRWRPVATLCVTPGNNVGVVFATASLEQANRTDLLIGLRNTMVPSDELINMRTNQLLLEVHRPCWMPKQLPARLQLHSGYSAVAQLLLEQLRRPLRWLLHKERLGTALLAGFGMGGGIAGALAVHLSVDKETCAGVSPRLHTVLFGAPRFGNLATQSWLQDLTYHFETVAAIHDFATQLPCRDMPRCHSIRVPTAPRSSYLAGDEHDDEGDDIALHRLIHSKETSVVWDSYADPFEVTTIDPPFANKTLLSSLEYHTFAYNIVSKDQWYSNNPKLPSWKHPGHPPFEL